MDEKLENINIKNCEENYSLETKLPISSSNLDSPFKKKTKMNSLRKKIKLLVEKFVIMAPFYNFDDYEDFSNKTTFKLIWVNCPVKIRFNNYQKKYKDDNFEKFLEQDYKINKIPNLRRLQENSFLQINNDSTLENFAYKISNLFSYLCENIRPHWDDYFMNIAHIVANRSNCIKQKVGAIIVKNNRILSTGYNGTPSKIQNCIDGECPRCNSDDISQGEQLDKCFCIHAEENALLEIGKTLSANATLYTTVYPCLLCSKLMIQCGISKVVYDRDYNTEHTDYILSKGKIQVEKWNKKNPF